MPIPPQVVAQVLAYVVRMAPRAYKAGRLIEKFISKKFGKYVIEIERRDTLGADGAASHIVRFLFNNSTRAVWHVVVRAGKIIHKHLLQ